MIKKLRMKLIIASMMSLLAVLLIIEGIAGALNYNRIVAEADQTLEILEENNGKFPDVPPPEKPSEKKKEGRMSSELPMLVVFTCTTSYVFVYCFKILSNTPV